MKILILNTSDLHGGAAKAAYRLCLGLRKNGVEAKMLVLNKQSYDPNVIPLHSNKIIRKFWSKVHPFKKRYFDQKIPEFSTLFSLNHILSKINKIDPDIIHLHWINGGFFDLRDLKKISIPLVWSLHDMWPFTGGCHYDRDCGQYQSWCEKCPLIPKNPKTAKYIFNQKMEIFNRKDNLTVIGLSRWLAECSKNSMLFKKFNTVNLPNCIDTNVYKPLEVIELKRNIGIPQDKRVILFSAMNPSIERKGFKYLKKAIENKTIDETAVIILGKVNDKEFIRLGPRTYVAGNINNERDLAKYYSMADVTVLPSIQENLSNIVMESLSCGTPVVAFNIGGNIDMIEHKRNGYLVKHKDTIDLANGIKWVLENEKRHRKLSRNSRIKIINEFSEKVVIPKYIDLYRKILSEKNN